MNKNLYGKDERRLKQRNLKKEKKKTNKYAMLITYKSIVLKKIFKYYFIQLNSIKQFI